MEKIKDFLKNIIVFIILILITFYIIFKNQSPVEIFQLIMNTDFKFILCGMIAMIIYFLIEAINVKLILSAFKEKISVLKMFKFTCIGFFFSAITPASTGGQPVEIYYMHKEKYQSAHATIALLIEYCCFQIIEILLGIIGAIANIGMINGKFFFIFLLGLFMCSIALFLMLAGVFSRRLSRKMVNFAIKVMKLFKIKNIEEKEKAMLNWLKQYNGSSRFIKTHKGIFIRSLVIVLFQLLVYYTVPYFIYRSFGFNDAGILRVISMQALLFTSVSALPLPGSIGISEIVFLLIFGTIYPANVSKSAMILNRAVTFYFMVILCALTVMINSMILKKKEKAIKSETL
jgi:uncharacterized protein (TIRG00374 family)